METRGKQLLQNFGWVFLAVVACGIFFFGKPMKVDFSEEHKTQIQQIAIQLCASASEHSCPVTWSGKYKWFGTIQPSTPLQGRVGIDQIRQTLQKPIWTEDIESNGLVFRNGSYEVFYASQSGAITITSLDGESGK
jgi:hypothetical protein